MAPLKKNLASLSLALLVGCSSHSNVSPTLDAGDDTPVTNDTNPAQNDTQAPSDTMAPSDTPVATDTPMMTDTPAPTDTPVAMDVATDGGAPMDAVAVDAGTGPSAGLRAVQMTPAGTVDLNVSGVVVTYTVQGAVGSDGGISGNDPAGFFVQAEMAGPALFVAVDPATLTPRPTPGDRVSFHVTMTRGANAGASRWVVALDGFSRSEAGVLLGPLVQDVSSASDLVTALHTYEHELITLTGTISGASAAAGTSFGAFPITTAGYPTGDTGLRLRLPNSVIASTGARMGCRFTISQTPLWRFNTGAQPSAWNTSDIALSMCPPVMDAGTDAATTDATTPTDVRTDAVVEAGPDVPGCAAHVVINEFAVAGPMGASDEFVELFNTGTCTVNLEGWTLKYSSASGSTPSTLWTGAAGLTLAPGGYVVLAPAATTSYATVRSGVLNPGMAAGGGAIAIFGPSATTAHDGVAYGTLTGTSPFIEGAMPAPVPSATQSVSRLPNGADTNSNATDFRLSGAITAGAVNR